MNDEWRGMLSFSLSHDCLSSFLPEVEQLIVFNVVYKNFFKQCVHKKWLKYAWQVKPDEMLLRKPSKM